MKPYDSFEHFKPEQWEVNRFWLYNRSLFLIYLTDQNNEFFHGGDGETLEQISANYKKSFYPECQDMIAKNPKIFNQAFMTWLDDMDVKKPPYMVVMV